MVTEFEKEQQIIDLRNKLHIDLGLPTLGFTDFDRKIVIENDNGFEEIVPVKHIYFEAKPNTRNNAIKTIIDAYTEKLGWEFIRVEKKAWVDGLIRYEICFRL